MWSHHITVNFINQNSNNRHPYKAKCVFYLWNLWSTVYPKKYAHGFCFAVLCCGYTLTDFPISIRLTSLALWQSNDCPSASKATLMNMDKYFMWIHYERLHNHNKAKHNKTMCIFLGIYCMFYICNCCSVSMIALKLNVLCYNKTILYRYGLIKITKHEIRMYKLHRAKVWIAPRNIKKKIKMIRFLKWFPCRPRNMIYSHDEVLRPATLKWGRRVTDRDTRNSGFIS